MLDQTTLLGIFSSVVVAGAGVFWKWVRDELKKLDEIPRLKSAIRVMAQMICTQIARDHPNSNDNLEEIIEKILEGERF